MLEKRYFRQNPIEATCFIAVCCWQTSLGSYFSAWFRRQHCCVEGCGMGYLFLNFLWQGSSKSKSSENYITLELAHKQKVTSFTALGDGRICSGSKDGVINIWDPNSLTLLKSIEAHSMGVKNITSFSSFLFSCSTDSTIRKWETKVIQHFNFHQQYSFSN